MGTNTIATVSDGTVIDASDLNQYKTSLVNDLVPRNTAGAPTDLDGSLGSTTYSWLKAHIESGYWTVGDIKPHHTYNGAAPIGQGWFPCLGGVINETNYNAIHGAGAWATYVVSSALDGKYAPDLASGYLTGASSTTQDGSSSITKVGNTSNQINIQHSHTVNSHTHTIDHVHANGTTITGGGVAVKDAAFAGSSGGTSPGTDSQLSTTQSIRPESTEVVYYIRII